MDSFIQIIDSFIKKIDSFIKINPTRHGCISNASLRRLRDISKRDDLQISETSPGRLIKDVSSETSLRSLRFSQRRL